jgi:membrane complex biogenesis BtpA family protein
MLTRETFESKFGTRPVLGMVHLLPLPGAPLFGGSLDEVIDAALRDARALREGGAAGYIVENFGDKPFAKTVGAETVAAITRVVSEVAREAPLPFGVNVLRNDAMSALAIAVATGAAFIRVNVLTGAMVTDQGIIEGDAAALMRLRESLGARNVVVFADHVVKHASPLAPVDPVQSAKDLRSRGLADVLVVTGKETGGEADASNLEIVRSAVPDAPVLLGSGLSTANADRFRDLVDGFIVGTSIKEGGRVDAPVDVARVRSLVAAVSS